MSLSGINRLQSRASGRFVLGMLLVAWLSIAAQPCLMAMEPAADTSLASEQKVHSEHNGHASHARDLPDCGHCPSLTGDQAVQCVTGSASDCGLLPGYNVDGRHFEKQAKDVSPPLTLFTLDDPVDCSMAVAPPLPRDVRRLKFTVDPPLNIRHCVFLK